MLPFHLGIILGLMVIPFVEVAGILFVRLVWLLELLVLSILLVEYVTVDVLGTESGSKDINCISITFATYLFYVALNLASSRVVHVMCSLIYLVNRLIDI